VLWSLRRWRNWSKRQRIRTCTTINVQTFLGRPFWTGPWDLPVSLMKLFSSKKQNFWSWDYYIEVQDYQDLCITGRFEFEFIYVYFSARYPPYSEKKINFLSFLLRKRKGFRLKCVPYLMVFTLGVVATVVFRAISKVRTDTLHSCYPHFFFNRCT